MGIFYALLAVHSCVILLKKPTWCTIFLRMFISFLYMFWATVCPSSAETTVLEVCHPHCVCENWKGYVVKHTSIKTF